MEDLITFLIYFTLGLVLGFAYWGIFFLIIKILEKIENRKKKTQKSNS
jgi:uncharacterized membrane protein YciS (DUF1049 family)